MSKFRDHLWLWGQDVMSHQDASFGSPRGTFRNPWCIPDGNKLDPADGARFLGVPNIFRVVMSGKPVPPFDEETRKMADMNNVVWSAVGDEGSLRNNESTDLPEVLNQAEKFPNVTGAVLDDFFRKPKYEGDNWARWDIETIRKMKEELHQATPRSLQFYVVWYKQALDWPVMDYLKEFDVITYWNLNSALDHPELKDDLKKMLERTPGMRRMAGCYLWNYGGGRPLTVDEIKFECGLYYDMMMKKEIEGIVFCANCVLDVGGPAIDWTRNWIAEHANDEIED